MNLDKLTRDRHLLVCSYRTADAMVQQLIQELEVGLGSKKDAVLTLFKGVLVEMAVEGCPPYFVARMVDAVFPGVCIEPPVAKKKTPRRRRKR